MGSQPTTNRTAGQPSKLRLAHLRPLPTQNLPGDFANAPEEFARHQPRKASVGFGVKQKQVRNKKAQSNQARPCATVQAM